MVRINFLVDEQVQWSGVKKPRVGNFEELDVSFVLYLNEQMTQ